MHIRSPLVLTVVFAIGCGSDAPRAQQSAVSEPASIQTAFLEDIVPLIDGAAYAIGADGVWYLSGTSAARVRPVGDSAVRAAFASALSLDVQPTADGGAYAVELTGGLWRLKADSAVLVRESSIVPSDTSIVMTAEESAGWLLYTRERRRQKPATEDDDRYSEPPLDDYDPAAQWP